MLQQTESIITPTSDYLHKYCNSEIIPIQNTNIRKEDFARQIQQDSDIKSGLICVLSAIEGCNSFKIKTNYSLGIPEILYYKTKCKHLYFYIINSMFGFMSVCLQTGALDIFGKDLEFLKSISKFFFNSSFITNKELQKILKDSSWSKGKVGKKLSSRNSRNLKLVNFKKIICIY